MTYFNLKIMQVCGYLNSGLAEVYSSKQNVIWASGNHTSIPVLVIAKGPSRRKPSQATIIRRVLDAVEGQGAKVLRFGFHEPTLDDVFIQKTGRRIADEAKE